MFLLAEIRDTLVFDKRRPPSYYLYLLLLLFGILWNVIAAVLAFAKPEATLLRQVVAALYFVLLIPEGFMIRFYLMQDETALDFLNISFLGASILHLLQGEWAWIVVMAIVWYVLQDYIRYREYRGQYLFK